MLRMIINLDRSKDRWQHMLGQMSDLGMDDGDFLRVSAVDGRKLTLEQLDNAVAPLNSSAKADFPGALTNTEIGCFLSHKKCWQQLLASHEEWGVVMEDDVRFSLEIMRFIRTDDWIPKGVDIVQLHTMRKQGRTVLVSGNKKCIDGGGYFLAKQVKPSPIGAQTYLINRRAAALALRLSEKIPAPVDDFLFQVASDFRTTTETWTLFPSVVWPDEAIESTIDAGQQNRHSRAKSLKVLLHPRRVIKKIRRWMQYHQNVERVKIAYR